MICPRFRGVGFLECFGSKEDSDAPRVSAPGRRQVVELARSGTKVAQLVATFGMSGATIYNWLRQEQIDRGEISGTSTDMALDLAAAKRRIRQLETELAVSRKVNEVFLEQGLSVIHHQHGPDETPIGLVRLDNVVELASPHGLGSRIHSALQTRTFHPFSQTRLLVDLSRVVLRHAGEAFRIG